jgi:glycosyltransferase involved in cell wall biosynthesis
MFTFAICAYKESPYLEDVVRSVLKQTIPVEILIATSTPSAYIENIAEKYNIPYFVNPQKDGGIATDWEFAVSCASTDYVAIAHQDDIYFPDYAAAVVERLRKQPESLIVFTDYCDLSNGKYLWGRGYLLVKRLLLWAYYLRSSWGNKFFKRLPLCLGNAISCPSVTYNVRKIGTLQFDRSFSVNLDWAMWLSLVEKPGKFSFIPKCLMAHRIHEGAETSVAILDQRRYNEDLRIFSQLWGSSVGKILLKFYQRSYNSGNHK